MARIRSLKPEIWMSPQVMNLSHSARLLFIGLITQADDEGRGTSDPRRLKAAIFGGDDETSSSIRRWLDEIQGQGLVALYEASPHGVLFELTGWKSHQKIDRAKQSAYPAPPSGPQRRLFDESSTSIRRGSDGSDRIGSSGSDRNVPVEHDESSNPASEGKSGPGSEGQLDDHAELSQGFALFAQQTYPLCTGRRKWTTALHSASVIVDSGKASEDDLRRRLRGYREHVDGGGVSGPECVYTPQNWFDIAGEDPPWAREWAKPLTRGEAQQHSNVEAGLAFLAQNS